MTVATHLTVQVGMFLKSITSVPARKGTLSIALLSLCLTSAHAETITLKNGKTVQGEVFVEGEKQLYLRTDDAPVAVWKEDIVSRSGQVASVDTAGGFPKLDACIVIAKESAWGKDIFQIPATVIDNGALRNVPYASFKAGDYEVNIYGDPDNPSGVEVGVYKDLINDQRARESCLAFVAGLMPTEAQRKVLRRLLLVKDLQELDGFTYEVTPADSPDAYGGWWISVYDDARLELSRAKDAEVQEISAPLPETEVAAVPPPVMAPSPPPAMARVGNATTGFDWSPREISYARRPSVAPTVRSSPYVRSYTRKDGTYVRSHSRRR
jgi:hypothetical protein